MSQLALQATAAGTPAENEKQCVILGAGAPHFGQTPALLHEPVRGFRVLEWILNALGASAEQTTLIVGYQAAEIEQRYPELQLINNHAWDKTGSAMSLLEASLAPGRSVYACYGDILFRSEVVTALDRVNAPLAIAWDSSWSQSQATLTPEELLRCEKVMGTRSGNILRLGADVPADWANGKFIGLVRFSPEAIARLQTLRADMPESLRQCHLSGLIEWLRSTGMHVAGVDVAGGWAEVKVPADIARFVLGTKAETLKRLQQLMTTATIQDQIAFTVHEWRRDPVGLIGEIRARFEKKRIVVRSSARSEDSFGASNAGAYASLLDLDPQTGLQTAIDTVIESYRNPQSDDQVLVQPMVTGVALCGVALTRTLEHGAPYYVINYDETGSTHRITDGTSHDQSTLFVRRDSSVAEMADKRLAPLLGALREIEELLGFDALDVEFALDKAGCVHILQVRPIAVRHAGHAELDSACLQALKDAQQVWRRMQTAAPHLPGGKPMYGVMPDWNPAEIIGNCPGQLAESLYRYLLLDDVWATQRAEYGYRDVRPQPLLVSFAGHPYVDVRASLSSFIPARVPDALAAKLIGYSLNRLSENPHLHDKIEFEVIPTCLSFGFDAWRQRLAAAGFSENEITCLETELRGLTAQGMVRTEHDLATIGQLQNRFEKFVRDKGHSSLERARLLFEDCKRLGTLPFAHLARGGFIAVTLLQEAVSAGIISAAARESFFSTIRTVSHELVDDANAVAEDKLSWDRFVARYGHLRPGTYDITSPCYAHDPERYLRPLVAHAAEARPQSSRPAAWDSEKDKFFAGLRHLGLPCEKDSVERFLRQAIEGREFAKFIFSRNLSAALEAIARYGDGLGLTREHLAHVALDDILIAKDKIVDPAAQYARLLSTAQAGERNRSVARTCELPPLLTSERDLMSFVLRSEMPNYIGSSRETADCCVLGTGANQAPLAGSIVLIPQADPGYDWIFGHGIAGLITMYGGANSHMAIRAAEFGLPAAIGVGEQRYKNLIQAATLELDPANKTIRILR